MAVAEQPGYDAHAAAHVRVEPPADSAPARSGAATADFWGTKNAGINYGMLFTAWGVAGIIGPRIGGTLFNKYHNYQAAFYAASVLAAVALLCEMFARRPDAPADR